MNTLGLYPFVRLIIPFISGIIIGIKFLPGLPVSTNILLVLIFCCFLIILLPQIFITYRTRWLFGIIVFLFLLFSSVKLSQVRTLSNDPFFFQNVKNKIDYYVADISEPLSEKNRSYKTILKLRYLKTAGKWIPCTGNICVYFKKDSTVSGLEYGDRIIFMSGINEIDPPQNPHEFDYRKYLARNNIYHQVFLENEDYIIIDKQKTNPVFAVAYSARKKLLHSLSDESLDHDEFAVASALLLGFKDELDPELRSAYSSAGAMHILCVSGLHVGVIFLVLNAILGFLGRIKYGDHIRMILLMLTVWFYAFITGLSPSVLRASCMISLIIISKSLNRHVNIYNVLAASAFILLMINPYMLGNIGFQLSYLAVTGIVSVYQHINSLWSTGFLITDKIWSICAVSIAAQLATFPLSLYYFHQFPNLFLLTNIIVIPLSSVIIYTGMAVFVFIPVNGAHAIILEVLSFLVKIMNALIRMIDNIAFSSSKMIHISEAEMSIIYLILILIVLFINLKKYNYIMLAGIGAIFFLEINISQAIEKYNQKYLFVYNIKNSSAYDFVSGNWNCFIADSLLMSDIKKQEYHIMNNWCSLGLKDPNKLVMNNKVIHEPITFSGIGLFKRNNFIYFQSTRILILDRSADVEPISEKLRLDIIILSGNPDITINEIQECFSFKKIIIDSSNSRRKAEQWIRECGSLGVECYSVVHSGAYVCKF